MSARAITGLLLATSLLGGCASASDAPATAANDGTIGPRPDIVIVLVEDLHWDVMGVTGHPYAETPNIDRLAAEGALFTNAFHAVPLCSPNRASPLMGELPWWPDCGASWAGCPSRRWSWRTAARARPSSRSARRGCRSRST